TVFVERTIVARGRVDVLVGAVGGFAGGSLLETDAATWRRMLDLNLTSAFAATKAVAPHMVRARYGRVVLVASRAVVPPVGGFIAYTVSKAGVITLVQALAHEMRGHGVTANAGRPSTMATPAKRAAMPDSDRRGWVPVEAVADAIALLAREESAYMTGTLLAISCRARGLGRRGAESCWRRSSRVPPPGRAAHDRARARRPCGGRRHDAREPLLLLRLPEPRAGGRSDDRALRRLRAPRDRARRARDRRPGGRRRARRGGPRRLLRRVRRRGRRASGRERVACHRPAPGTGGRSGRGARPSARRARRRPRPGRARRRGSERSDASPAGRAPPVALAGGRDRRPRPGARGEGS